MNNKIGFPKEPYKRKSKTSEWIQVRRELKEEFLEAGIIECEIKMMGCFQTNFLGFAHTVKRRNVKDLKRVVLACSACHEKVEYKCKWWTGRTMEEYLEGIIKHRKFVIPVIY